MTPAGPGRARRRPGQGWVPRQHGAWAMLLLPLVVGIAHSGPAPWHLLLVPAWLVGYLAFHAAGLVLRSRGRARYRPPLVAYGSVAVLLTAATVAVRPASAWWALVYLPLLAVSWWASWHRRDRGWSDDVATVLAACLVAAVAHTPAGPLGTLGGLVAAVPADAWRLVAIIALYLLGTVLYVKTMIRERGVAAVRHASAAFHVLAVPAAALAVGPGHAPTLLAVTLLFGVLAARAVVVPRRWPGASPRTVGLGEVGVSLVLGVLLLGL